jgi:CubicO group peptidase (beta-lactamase class C family)
MRFNFLLVIGALVADGAVVPLPPASTLQTAIQPLVDELSIKYDCAVGVGFKSKSLALHWAAGTVDNGTHDTTGRDLFVWGSITKVSTGASVMQLVADKKFKLSDSIQPLIDPILRHLTSSSSSAYNFTCLLDLFGPNISKVTVRDLLGMSSGVPDYDTADGGTNDQFRKHVYENKTEEYSPLQILALKTVNTGSLKFPPGSRQSYSSTNFVLLGLLLAQHANGAASDWEDYDQGSFMLHNVATRNSTNYTNTEHAYKYNVSFAVHGAPKRYTRVKGYDRTSYNHQIPTPGGETRWAESIYRIERLFIDCSICGHQLYNC